MQFRQSHCKGWLRSRVTRQSENGLDSDAEESPRETTFWSLLLLSSPHGCIASAPAREVSGGNGYGSPENSRYDDLN